MGHKFTREELFQRLWEEPKQSFAKSLGISDVALGKICRQANIPIPERGYWAKKAAGKATVVPKLPPRFPGASDTVLFGPREWREPSDKDILETSIPAPPTFSEPLDSVRTRIEEMVSRVPYPHLSNSRHPLIAKLLAQDEKAAEEMAKSQFAWYRPKYDTPQKRRWLRILNAIFLYTQRLGCAPSLSTSKYAEDFREVSIRVGEQHVSFTLAPLTANTRRSASRQMNVKEDKRFRLDIHAPGATGRRTSWDDSESAIETSLTEIVREILFIGEVAYRHLVVQAHEWDVSRIQDAQRAEQQRRIEEARREKQRREQEEKARIDFLLQKADEMQKAEKIRDLVSNIVSHATLRNLPKDEIDAWAKWASVQADRIDPLQNLESIVQTGLIASLSSDNDKEDRDSSSSGAPGNK